MSNNALEEIKNRYKDCNILLPVSSEVQLNPFYKYTVMEVTADISENSGDIFKVGSVKTGEDRNGKGIFEDVYSPAKPLLMKLAAASGIQFDPNNTFGTYISKNCYKAKAYGAMRMPDGTGKTHVDEKVINLEDEEDRLRLEFMDKSIEGISEWKASQAASKMFKGEWVDTGEKNDKGYPIKIYKIADSDRQAYIDRSVLVNMTLLRKTFAEKAMTGAILRVIRALIGLKGTYTIAELKKPFAVPKVTFSPDYNDQMVRKAMLEQGMNSVGNMFNTVTMDTHIELLDTRKDKVIDTTFNPEEFTDNPAFAIETPTEVKNWFEPEKNHEEDLPEAVTEPQEQGYKCDECETAVNEKVYEYSLNKFGRPLCMKCQKGAK